MRGLFLVTLVVSDYDRAIAWYRDMLDFALADDHALYTGRGVAFMEAPRHEAYGTVAVFRDICGNLWDVIEHR